MKTFMAVFVGSSSPASMAAWTALDPKVRAEREQAGMAAWGQWVAKHEAAIVDNGSPLGKTKRIDKNGVSDIKNLMAAYVVVRAESHDAAAMMFIDHPHFTLFPGDGVEVMERIPIPAR